MKATSAKVASRRVRKIEESGVSWKTTSSLYWLGKRQRKADTAKRICAGARRRGSTELSGSTKVFARKKRLTSAPSLRSQRKIVKSWIIVGPRDYRHPRTSAPCRAGLSRVDGDGSFEVGHRGLLVVESVGGPRLVDR